MLRLVFFEQLSQACHDGAVKQAAAKLLNLVGQLAHAGQSRLDLFRGLKVKEGLHF